MNNAIEKRTVGFLLYPRFEILDTCGPLEMFGVLNDYFDVCTVAEHAGPVPSDQKAMLVADHGFETGPHLDIVLVPGGIGSRKQVENKVLLDWLRAQGERAEIVCSVCTGSGILAKAGLLDGLKATSNKMNFDWAVSQGPNVNWIRQARWIDEGHRATSSGVTAGMDMALALIERLCGASVAHAVADGTEFNRTTDPSDDPFASIWHKQE